MDNENIKDNVLAIDANCWQELYEKTKVKLDGIKEDLVDVTEQGDDLKEEPGVQREKIEYSKNCNDYTENKAAQLKHNREMLKQGNRFAKKRVLGTVTFWLTRRRKSVSSVCTMSANPFGFECAYQNRF